MKQKQMNKLEKLTARKADQIKGGYTPLQDVQWNLTNSGTAPRIFDDYR